MAAATGGPEGPGRPERRQLEQGGNSPRASGKKEAPWGRFVSWIRGGKNPEEEVAKKTLEQGGVGSSPHSLSGRVKPGLFQRFTGWVQGIIAGYKWGKEFGALQQKYKKFLDTKLPPGWAWGDLNYSVTQQRWLGGKDEQFCGALEEGLNDIDGGFAELQDKAPSPEERLEVDLLRNTIKKFKETISAKKKRAP